MRKNIQILSCVIACALLAACGGSKNQENSPADSTAMAPKSDSVKAVKDVVMYNIPSPLETFTILKMSGSQFDRSLLNPVDRLPKYVSTFSKSLNLGIYSADLSFCFMYKQNQDFNNYLKNINELTTALGIDGSYGQDVTKRLQANANNMDSLMSIAQEASVNADLYLKENQRSNTTVLIATGSWIEGMHIIASLAGKKPESSVKELVGEQKISLRNLIKMLDQFGSDAEITALAADLKDLNTVMDPLQPSKAADAAPAENKGLKSIGNNTTIDLTKEQLNTILTKVEALRNKLTL